MSKYILRRLIVLLPVLFGISVVVFGFIHLIPGDPVVTILGSEYTQETAELMGISEGAVKTRLHRARLALRELLEPHLREESP